MREFQNLKHCKEFFFLNKIKKTYSCFNIIFEDTKIIKKKKKKSKKPGTPSGQEVGNI